MQNYKKTHALLRRESETHSTKATQPDKPQCIMQGLWTFFY